MIRRLLLAFALFALASPAFAQEEPFEVGQVWTLQPPGHPDARVRVGRIEDHGQTIHISMWGVPAPAPQITDIVASPLIASHLPITSTALRNSVAHRVDDNPPTDLQFEEGYRTWREAEGGVFTLTVPEIIDAIHQTVETGTPSKQ